MNIGSLQIELLANVARLQADMDSAKRTVGGAMGDIQKFAGNAMKALGALGVGLSVGAFAGMIKGTIDAAAGLHDMSIQTGASVASLMALKAVAATSDTTIDGIATAMNKLAKNMAVASEESKGTGQAIQAIGLDFATLKGLSPDQQMIQVAKALDKFQDGAGKSAVAMTLFGKEGAKMLPFLKDLADESDSVSAKLTKQQIDAKAAQAAMADDFGDNLAKIKEVSEEWKRELSAGMLPALVEASNEFLTAANSAGGFTDAIKRLSADGTITIWTRNAIEGIKALAAAIIPAMKIATAYFAIFVAAPAIFAYSATAMGTLQLQIALAKMEMASGATISTLLSTSLGGVTVSATLASGALGVLKVAGGVLFAAFAGWEIGTYLRDNFVEARVAGLVFVSMVLKGWENVKYGAELAWEGIKFAWDKTIGAMKIAFAEYLSGVAKGLAFVGATDTSSHVTAYADALRASAGATQSFSERTAAMTTAHRAAMTAIDGNIADLVKYEIVADAAAKGTKSLGDAVGKIKPGLDFNAAGMAAASEAAKKLAEAAKKAAQDYADLINKINGKDAGLDADFQQNIAILKKGYDDGKQSLEEYVATVEKYIKQQKFSIDIDKDKAHAQEQVLNFNKQYSEGLELVLAPQKKAIDNAIAEAEKNEELARTFGLTASQINALELARLEEQLAQRSASALTLDEIDGLEKLIDAKKRSAASLGKIEAMEKEKELWKSIETTAHDTFISIFDSGKSAFDRLRDTLKNGLLELLYQMTVKQWIFQIGAVVSGGGAGGQGALGTASSASSFASMGSTMYNGFAMSAGNSLGSLGSMFGSNAISSFASGLSGVAQGTIAGGGPTVLGSSTGIGSVSSGASGAGSTLGAVGGYAAIIAAAMAINDKLYGQGWNIKNGTNMNMAGTLLTGATSGYLNPILGPVQSHDSILQSLGLSSREASLLSGSSVISRLFGNKDPEVTRQNVSGQFGPGGFSGQTATDWFSKGGWFSSDKSGTNTAPIDAATVSKLSDSYAALKEAAANAAKVLGVSADVLATSTQSISFDLAHTGDAAADAAENQKRLAAALAGVSDQIATSLIPNIADFAAKGESAGAAFERVSNDYLLIDASLTAIGTSFGSVGVSSLAAREKLLELSGGLDNFVKGAAFFQQNFLDETARKAPVLKAVTDQMAALGYAGVNTRDGFRDIVLGLNLTDAAQAKTYASLMSIEEAFAQVYPAIDHVAEAAKAAAAAQEELAKAQAKAQAEQAAQAAIADGIYAQRMADQAAADSRQQELASQRASMELMLYNLTHTAEEQVTHQRELEMAAMSATLGPLQSQIYSAQDLAAAARIAATALDAAAASARAIAGERASLEREMLTLQGNTAALRGLEVAALDPSNRALKESIFALQDKQAADQAAAQAAAAAAAQAQQWAQAQAQAAEESRRAAEQLKSAWSSITTSIFSEVARIRGLVSGNSAQSLAGAQSQFAIATAQARAGDQEAAKLLPGLSKQMIDLAEKNASTEMDFRRVASLVEASLTVTGSGYARQYGFALPSGERASSSGGDTSALSAAIDRLTRTVDEQRQALDSIRRDTRRQADLTEAVSNGGQAFYTQAA